MRETNHAIDEIAGTFDLSEDKSIPFSGDHIDAFCVRQYSSLMTKAKFAGYFDYYHAMFRTNIQQVHYDVVVIVVFGDASMCRTLVVDQWHYLPNADLSMIASRQIKMSRQCDADCPLKCY